MFSEVKTTLLDKIILAIAIINLAYILFLPANFFNCFFAIFSIIYCLYRYFQQKILNRREELK